MDSTPGEADQRSSKFGVIATFEPGWQDQPLPTELSSEAMPQIIWRTRPDGWSVSFNGPWHEYTGLSPEQSEGWGWQKAIHPDDLPNCLGRWQAALASGEPYEVEYRFRRADGSYRWFLGRGLPVRGKDGRVVSWLGTCTDIDDQKRLQEELTLLREELEARVDARTAALNAALAELRFEVEARPRSARAALREQADLLKSILESTADAVMVAELDGRLMSCNAAAERMFGPFPEDLSPESWSRQLGLFRPDGITPFPPEQLPINRAIRGESVAHVEGVRRGGGLPDLNWLADVARPLRDEDGRVIGGVMVCRDITRRKVEGEAIGAGVSGFLKVIEDAPVALAVLDPGLRYLVHSEKWLDVHGMRGRSILGLSDREVFPNLPARLVEAQARALAGESVAYPEERMELPDGRVTLVRWAVRPWRGPEGRIAGIIVATEPIDELVAGREAALAASRLKSEFLANMSHEIRTPMNGVLGLTELLLETPLDEIQRDYAATIRHSAEILLTILDDVLDYSKIEAGKLSLKAVPFDLGAMIEDVADLMAPGAHRKGLSIASQIPPDLPQLLEGDPVRLRQILTNLVSNAVKFTQAGSVILALEILAGPGDDVSLRLSVRDTGIGIDPGQHDAVFESFRQSEAGIEREYGGTGLGLAICRQLAGLMGGRLDLQSEPGVGSTFRLDLTLRQPPHSVGHRVEPPRNLHVLIVDLDEALRESLAAHLAAWGCRVEEATGVEPSTWKLLDRTHADPFDLALVDERALSSAMVGAIPADLQRTAVPLVLLHSLGARHPGRVSGSRPFAATLTKPIRRAELSYALSLAAGGPVETREDRPPAPASLDLRVLLAEDNEVNRKVALQLLKGWGCTALTVADGRQAVEAAGRERFDLILMDVQMPVMDGLAATAEIRRREQGTGDHVPILAMTARAMEEDRLHCLKAGMDDYVTKPIRPPLLRQVIERLISPRGGRAPDHVRTGRLREICDDPEFEREVLAVFLAEAPALLRKLADAIAARDAIAANAAAHSLKGSCLTIGADSLAGAFLEIETLARAGALDESQAIMGRLDSPWGMLLDSLTIDG